MRGYEARSGWHIFARITRLIRLLIRQGRYRSDIDPSQAALALLSLVIGPLIIVPAWHQQDADNEFSPSQENWIRQVSLIIDDAFLPGKPHDS